MTDRLPPTKKATTAKTARSGTSPASTQKLAGLPSRPGTQNAKQLVLVVEVVVAAAIAAAEDEREAAAEVVAVAVATLTKSGPRRPVAVLVVVASYAITATRRAISGPIVRT